MLPQRRPTKKLIIAFHFQFANQAAWKCDGCRSSGLVRERGCALAGEAEAARPVWARRGQAVRRCPKSVITGDSLSLVEEFFAWKLGGGVLQERNAKSVDAFFALEREWQKEIRDGEQ